MKLKTIFITVVLLFSFFQISFAQKGFMKLGDIKGESTRSDVKDWIKIDGFNQSMEKGAVATGATRRQSLVSFADIVLMKELDKSSPKLMEACAKGQVIPNVELILLSNSGRELYKVTLENSVITGISSETICDPVCKANEKVTLNYSKISWEYTTNTGEKIITSYNVKNSN